MTQRNGTNDTNGTVHRNGTAGPDEKPLEPFGNGRAAGGRFAPGNPGGPGNPYARQVAELRKAFLSAASPEKMKELADKLLSQALSGDTAAASLFLAYALGKPGKAADPDRVDLEEWALLDASPSDARVWARMLECVPPHLAAELLRDILAGKTPRGIADEIKSRRRDIEAEMACRIGK
jgi:hypothetical protein